MQAFIFGASRIGDQTQGNDKQLVLEKLIKGQRILDWTIHGLQGAGVSENDISFIGGYQIERIIKQYPTLHYIINPRWADTHVIGSLRYAVEYWKGGDVLLMYADTLFRANVLQQIINTKQPITIGVDSNWLTRVVDYGYKYNAEKVVLDNGAARKFGRKSIRPDEADAQFSGLSFIRKDVFAEIVKILSASDKNNDFYLSDNESLISLLEKLNDIYNIHISTIDVAGLWAEIDSQQDLARFVFGTKAETLDRIKPFIRKSRMCDQIHFTLKNWDTNQNQIIAAIQKLFKGKNLIIRSSSLEEDSWTSSQAGAFLSISNVMADDTEALSQSIDAVISKYHKNDSNHLVHENQVLVQPYITDIDMSGVAFSKILETGGPYYLINYDDITKRTDTVTSGNNSTSKSITIYKNAKDKIKDQRINKVVSAVEELEMITGYSSLDVEFVLTSSGELHIVQVRPIATHTGLSEINGFQQRIEQARLKVKNRLKKYPHIYGKSNVLADMPDWNPAEMIGIRPKPLSVSLYQYLITDSAWRIARGKMGYHNPSPEKLLFCIAGHPYIDVRNSFNNLIPDGLSPDLSEKLIDHYIGRLQSQPHLHDKVEFEIAITCYTPDIETHIQRLSNAGFSLDEINQLKEKLRMLTEDAITGKNHSVETLLAQAESLNPRRQALIYGKYQVEDIPNLVQTLLDDCIEHGTIPFSILARYGFIASSMMRGLVACKVITEEQKNSFLNSIETVASSLVEDMNSVITGSYSKTDFLDKYGHLRPGSYDITSFSYNEKPDHYFPENFKQPKGQKQDKEEKRNVFSFDKKTKTEINHAIKQMGMSFSVEQLLHFVKEATAGREYAKFQFSKNLSTALQLISEYGENFGFTRDEMSYVFIEDIIRLNKFALAQEPVLYLKQKIQEGKMWHQESNKIESPQFISSPEDLDIIVHNASEPNYVTSKTTIAPIITLSSLTDKKDLEGKIILIEGADPGYDWIFLHPIKGLITKYGGAASHMTIRCAEFGLPAAIGCGEELYKRLLQAHNVELNCANKKIRVLSG